MPTGERPRQRGFTYLWLMFVLAIGAAGGALLAQVWSTASQREREREQIFRGRQIGQALWSFQAASGVGPSRAPRSFDELLEDHRGPSASRPLRHLRRLFEDPFTGQADWVVERDDQQGIVAVRSRSNHPSRIVMPGEGGAGARASAAGIAALAVAALAAEADSPASGGSPGVLSTGWSNPATAASAVPPLRRVSDRRFSALPPPNAPAAAPRPPAAAASSPRSPGLPAGRPGGLPSAFAPLVSRDPADNNVSQGRPPAPLDP